MKEFFSSFTLTVLCFSLLFGIQFSFFPISLSKVALVFLFFNYILYSSYHRKFLISRYFIPIILFLIGIGIYSVFITLIKGKNDFTFISRLIFIIYEPLLGGYLFAYYVYYIQGKGIESVIVALRNAGLIQAVLTIPAYFNESVRGFYDALLPNSGNIKLENIAQRVRGFSNLGGAWLSSMLCLTFLCAMHQIDTGKHRLLNVLSLVLMLAAMIFTGRTGLMISLLFFGFYIIRWLFLGVLRRTFGYIIILLTIVAFSVFQLDFAFLDSVNEQTLNWAFEAFSNDEGVGRTGSSDRLMEMIYMPESTSDILLGAGQYIKGTYKNPRTDSGYMKVFLAVGLIVGLFFYLIYIVLSFKLVRNYYYKSKSVAFFLLLVLLNAFLIEIKEPFLQTLGYTFAIFGFFFLSNLERQEDRRI